MNTNATGDAQLNQALFQILALTCTGETPIALLLPSARNKLLKLAAMFTPHLATGIKIKRFHHPT